VRHLHRKPKRFAFLRLIIGLTKMAASGLAVVVIAEGIELLKKVNHYRTKTS